jgi:hypothetical protein
VAPVDPVQQRAGDVSQACVHWQLQNDFADEAHSVLVYCISRKQRLIAPQKVVTLECVMTLVLNYWFNVRVLWSWHATVLWLCMGQLLAACQAE